MQKNVELAVANPPASLRRWFGGHGLRRGIPFIPGEIARRVTIALRQDRLLARLGASAAWQIAVLPSDITGLVEQLMVVETEAIRWGGRPPRKFRDSGLAILDGDWDRCCKQEIEAYLYSVAVGRSIREIFVEGRHYTETIQYSKWIDKLEQGRKPKRTGCDSLADIHNYFHQLHQAFQTIKTQGYRSQAELGTGMPHREIMVYVDRNGELHKQQGEGHHRLAIARLLKVKHVPVCVLGVHRLWVEQCHRRFGGDVISALRRGLAEQISVKPPDQMPHQAALPQDRLI